MQNCNLIVRQTHFAQDIVSVLAEPRRWSSDASRRSLESRCWTWLAQKTEAWLLHLLYEAVVHDLLVVHHLRAAQDRCARHIRGVETLKPVAAPFVFRISPTSVNRSVALADRSAGV